MANPFAPTGVKLTGELIQESWRRKLVLEHKNATLFTALTGTVENSKNAAVPGIVVEKNQDLQDGSDRLNVPFLAKLKNGPIIGDQDALGQEEKQNARFFEVPVDDVQQAVSIKNKGLQAWKNKPYGFMEEVFPQLRMWWNEYDETEHFNTFINGFSLNLTDTDSAVGKTALLHPNIYVADTGLVAFNATEATYATNVNAAVDALDTAGTGLSLTLIDKMSTWAKQKKIQPIPTRGGNMYALFAHENAIFQLRTGNSGEWNALMKDAEQRGLLNRGIRNLVGSYRDIMVFEAERAPTVGARDAEDDVVFGLPTVAVERPSLSQGDDTTLVVNILAGQGSICSAVGQEINFDEEFYSYRFTKGVGTHKLYGKARPDFLVETGTTLADSLQARYNQSSFLVFTDSAGF